jgi:hypothetical protein
VGGGVAWERWSAAALHEGFGGNRGAGAGGAHREGGVAGALGASGELGAAVGMEGGGGLEKRENRGK